MAAKNSDKVRIRQKLNLELGNLLFTTNKKLSLNYINKVINVKDGASELVNLAKKNRAKFLLIN